MTKEQLRQEVRQRFAQSSSEERDRWSCELCESLLADPQLLSAHTILAFRPMKDEVNILPALHAFLSEGKNILLPRVVSPTEMTLYVYTGRETLADEKEENVEEFDELDRIDAVIVPGMAFTRQGVRLGRGKGYYDRFLPLVPRAYLRGVCFPYQILPEIPHEPHDVLVPIFEDV